MIGERDWTLYKEGNQAARERIMTQYLPLVKNVAGRMAMGFPRSVELDDLISTGTIGLIDAIGNFDPERGVKFETYAVPRIRGAILDELRALDWIPRSTRAKARSIDRATVELENLLGRKPAGSELARKLEWSHAELQQAMDDISGTSLLSLDEMVYREEDNRQVPRVETVHIVAEEDVLSDIEKMELRAYLVTAVETLPDQERLVIGLYYYEELTLKEIGTIMSISESRVSQIHTKAVRKLRTLVREKFGV
jgi:RNA polymerase sigma factor for flagellar operon FliA